MNTTYPDPLKPEVDPTRLQSPDYDPFGLMPSGLPDHPRVFLDAAQLAAARRNLARQAWAQAACRRLLDNCRPTEPLPDTLPCPPDSKLNDRVAGLALRNALAALLTGDDACRARALQALRLLADGYTRWTLAGGDRLAAGGNLNESRFNRSLAWTFDLLAAAGLDDRDRDRFLAMLAATVAQSDANQHPTCSNHNTWCLVGRLAVAAARGDRQGLHDALYGCDHGRGWRYGIIHQLRHDILSDGLHWEGSLGYHFYTLMAFTELAMGLANLGSDLWHAQLPPLFQTDGQDLHRAYGPDHGTKCLRAAFDAPFYHAFPNGEFSVLHDSGLAHLRGIWIWGILYNKAWEAYRDPKYAWLLTRMERDYPPAARTYPDLPMPLNTHSGDLDFARLRDWPPPAGRFSFKRNTALSLSGRHTRGCSLFPVHGSAVLRSRADDPDAAAAFLYWGPHSAGHMGPASLHLDLAARSQRLTDAPHSGGYDDPLHLTWNRTTLAHNTVTVDQTPMFPYDFETQSIWECDKWRDRTSNGRLALFQTSAAFQAVRAVNDSVYPGVRLDRTVVVTPDLILDVFRAVGESEHVYDWAVHVPGLVTPPPGATAFAPGPHRGYGHLTDVFETPPRTDPATGGNGWTLRTDAAAIRLLAPAGGRLITARDPIPAKARLLGALEDLGPRSTVLVRSQGRNALFVSLWVFDPTAEPGLERMSGTAAETLVLETRLPGAASRWIFPFQEKHVRLQPGHRAP